MVLQYTVGIGTSNTGVGYRGGYLYLKKRQCSLETSHSKYTHTHRVLRRTEEYHDNTHHQNRIDVREDKEETWRGVFCQKSQAVLAKTRRSGKRGVKKTLGCVVYGI
jgi:hypothetical protein